MTAVSEQKPRNDLASGGKPPGNGLAGGTEKPTGGAGGCEDDDGASLSRRKRGGRVRGYLYLKTPKEARALIVRGINGCLVGALDDPHYLREKEKYEAGLKAYDEALAAGRRLELPEKPKPPKLNPAELNALSGAIRTWLECRDSEIDDKLKEIAETNDMLLKLLEQRGFDVKGGGGRPN